MVCNAFMAGMMRAWCRAGVPHRGPAACRPGRLPVRLALAALFLAALAAWAAGTCDSCGKALPARFLESGGRSFCSQECYRQTLPVCATCGQVVSGRHLIHAGRHYCSTACFERTLPTCVLCGQVLREAFTIEGRLYCRAHAEGPRCDSCGLPVDGGTTLNDGRRVCDGCHPSLVFDDPQAIELYHRSRRLLAVALGEALPPAPPLHLVGREALPEHPGLEASVSIRELGRYQRETVTTTTRNVFGRVLKEETAVTRRILILYGLAVDSFISTAVHELTHDLIAERYPVFEERAPEWAKEGLCQYAAAMVCRRLGSSEVVAEIETATDEIYGDGYRWWARRFGQEGWDAIRRWLEQGDIAALPARAAPPSPR